MIVVASGLPRRRTATGRGTVAVDMEMDPATTGSVAFQVRTWSGGLKRTVIKIGIEITSGTGIGKWTEMEMDGAEMITDLRFEHSPGIKKRNSKRSATPLFLQFYLAHWMTFMVLFGPFE